MPLSAPRYDLLPDGACLVEDELSLNGAMLSQLAADFGTPLFVYSEQDLRTRFEAFRSASAPDTLICFAVKANPALGVLRLLAELGAGFDVVSAGEIHRVLEAGGQAQRIVFSGVGKSNEELAYALRVGVGCINLESRSEMLRLSQIASSLGKTAAISVRVNPDIDPQTHPYISTGLKDNKFGIPMDDAEAVYLEASRLPGLKIVGIDCHIGSQITLLEPFAASTGRVLALAERLHQQGISIEHLDLGGGLGIRYRDETPPTESALMGQAHRQVADWASGLGIARPHLMFEFGRALVGRAGLLLTRVEALKPSPSGSDAKQFAVVDAAMNDLMRPSLYESWHEVMRVNPCDAEAMQGPWEIVGPICESGDWLARGRDLDLKEGDLLAFASAGAYGMSMSSNYNSRCRAAEVMITPEGQPRLIRRRETLDDLLATERL